MKTILIYLYLKLSSLFGLFPELLEHDDFFSFSSGPLRGLSFVVKIDLVKNSFQCEHRIIMVPEKVSDLIYNLEKHVDLYIQAFIKNEIVNLSKKNG